MRQSIIASFRSVRVAPLLVFGALACASARTADAPAASQPGILVMAHGGNDAWNASVQNAVAPLARIVPVAVAFGMADPNSLQEAVTALERRSVDWIAVVRLFVSIESFSHDIEYFFGFRPDPPARFAARTARAMATPGQLTITAGVGLNRSGLSDSPLIGDVLAQRALAQSISPENETVLILAHGMGSDSTNDELLRRIDLLANQVRTVAPFRTVMVETLREDWSAKRAEAERRIRHAVKRASADGGRVITVPFRLSGFGPYRDVLDGLPYVADGIGLLPHENVTTWIAQQASEEFRRAGTPNPIPAGTAFF